MAVVTVQKAGEQQRQAGASLGNKVSFDRGGRAFYKNPLDAPKGVGSLQKMAAAEYLATDPVFGAMLSKKNYKDLQTPLEKYCAPLSDFDLPAHLQDLADAAWKQGRKLRILDVGVGEGGQWLGFLKRNEGKAEFFAVALTDAFTIPELRPCLRICEAVGMAHEFPAGSFDIIVSHSGMHQQGLAGIKAIEWLLKPGAEAVVSMSSKTSPDTEEILAECPSLSIVQSASDLENKSVSYRFAKKDG